MAGRPLRGGVIGGTSGDQATPPSGDVIASVAVGQIERRRVSRPSRSGGPRHHARRQPDRAGWDRASRRVGIGRMDSAGSPIVAPATTSAAAKPSATARVANGRARALGLRAVALAAAARSRSRARRARAASRSGAGRRRVIGALRPRARSSERPARWSRDLTVPSRMPEDPAISAKLGGPRGDAGPARPVRRSSGIEGTLSRDPGGRPSSRVGSRAMRGDRVSASFTTTSRTRRRPRRRRTSRQALTRTRSDQAANHGHPAGPAGHARSRRATPGARLRRRSGCRGSPLPPASSPLAVPR